MKYYSKDWYSKMQVYGFLLSFPETKEEWDKSIKNFESYGRDYIKNHKEDLEILKNDLLKFLPEPFHQYINDGTLNTSYPSEKLRNMINNWKDKYNQQMEELDKEYLSNYNSSKDLLPFNIVKLNEISLHDSNVISIENPTNDTFVIYLDCEGGFNDFSEIKLTFKGVKEISMPENIKGGFWLYDEVYPTKIGFELHVLFDIPFIEFKIVAEDIVVEGKNL
ncbi:DUF4085 family protein [Gottfriedia acidiceleris]|uniref:DUF4085 family protein n=1 Tax=Bacillaceae TaxID=186817 RepID=UPI000BEDEDA3|nr:MULTISPECIES: DUF4085 family protein [unclassified Bacillus (in: firmicutes)]PEC48780.1 hypothetical protein CON00_14465 [Bacillus sp. AFS096315]PFM82800.1 hypothetical protein COJ46_03040 [Bacillus sp. AFS077874]